MQGSLEGKIAAISVIAFQDKKKKFNRISQGNEEVKDSDDKRYCMITLSLRWMRERERGLYYCDFSSVATSSSSVASTIPGGGGGGSSIPMGSTTLS